MEKGLYLVYHWLLVYGVAQGIHALIARRALGTVFLPLFIAFAGVSILGSAFGVESAFLKMLLALFFPLTFVMFVMWPAWRAWLGSGLSNAWLMMLFTSTACVAFEPWFGSRVVLWYVLIGAVEVGFAYMCRKMRLD